MRRISLVVLGLYIKMFGSFAQPVDSPAYRPRKLTMDEINFVGSYYRQNGNNSAITGGTGTEKLMDISNGIDVKFFRYNKKERKVTLDLALGVDYYTSASSDKIDPGTISSASKEDLRIYPSVTRSVMNEKTGKTFSTGISYSHESDYLSYGVNFGFTKKSSRRNSEFSARSFLYFDRVKIILPIEFRDSRTGGFPGAANEHDYPWQHRNTVSISLNYSRVISRRLQLMWILDVARQEGFLGLPFHRVYFSDFTLATENLPRHRFKVPFGFRGNYFAGDRLLIRSFYRYYHDDWGISGHTAELETPVKITAFVSVTPFYRYYLQNGSDYFAPYKGHAPGVGYHTSNYDLSGFNSHFFGVGARFAPVKGLFNHPRFNSLELRGGYYQRSNGLHAGIISLHLKYK